MLARIAGSLYRRLKPRLPAWFFGELIDKTENFSHVTWLGRPIWQNVLDLWVMQETISEIKPALLIETGTNRGATALFFAHLFDPIGRAHLNAIHIAKPHHVQKPASGFPI